MKRFASHHIIAPRLSHLKLAYLELNDNNQLMTIQTLQQEIANTSFFNGLLLVVREDESLTIDSLRIKLQEAYTRNRQTKTICELVDQLPLSPVRTTDQVAVFNLSELALPSPFSMLKLV